MIEPKTPDLSEARDQRYRRAGLLYAVLGTLVILVTMASPEIVRPELRQELVHAWVGEIFILLFAALIARGNEAMAFVLRIFRMAPERARQWGAWFQTGLTLLLTFSAIGRFTVFIGNGFGHRPRILRDPMRFEVETVPAEPRMLICGLLMAGVVFVLVRTAWWPLLKGLGRHS